MKKILFLLMLGLCISWTLSAQSNPVEGTVVSSADGEPLIGVSVAIKGTTQGSVTNEDGVFKLNASPGDVLQITYLGFVAQEITVGYGRIYTIRLEEDTQLLDEVVVIGYGVQKKSVVSASISRVTSDDLNVFTPTRIEDALKGKVSGVTILQTSGQPGAGSDVRIRGIGTINSKSPLYIVDGMPVDGSISFLNPSDIESVEVLKDAASAAIYGARGANGVILVTTKNGQSGNATVNYDFTYGWQNPWKKKALLDAREYMILMNEMYINDGITPLYTAEQIRNAVNTDWQDEVFNYDAPVVNHQVSVSGGSEKNTYYLSFGYFNHEGIVGGNVGKSNVERYTLRMNATQNVYEAKDRDFLNKVVVGTNVNYTRGENSGVEANSEFGSILGSAITFSPNVPVYANEADVAGILERHPYAVKDNAGRLFSIPPSGFQEIANPIGMLYQPNKQINSEDVFMASFWAELNILPELKFRSSYSVDMSFWGNDGYSLPYFLATQGKDLSVENSSVTSEKNRRFAWQVENYFSYDKTFAGVHNVQVVLGQSAFKSSQSNLNASRTQPNPVGVGPDGLNIYDTSKLFLSNSPENLWDKARNGGGTGGVNYHTLASYFGRINYNFAERYILSASLRRDGSSRFGTNNKWATLPAFSVAWNILNEPFAEYSKPDWMDVAKLRFSWGKTGNESIGNLRYEAYDVRGTAHDYYYGTWDKSSGAWAGNGVSGVMIGALANPSIRWEESEQYDIGLDLRFLNSALTFTTDYYKKTTHGMLANQPIPGYVGQSSPIANIGTMENSGIEFEIGWRNRAGKVNYFVNANASYLKNKLVEYGTASGFQSLETQGNTGVGEYVRGSDGEVYPYFYGLVTDGLFQHMDEVNSYTYTFINDDGETVTQLIQPLALPGDVRFVDLNGDGQITDDDKTKIGKPMPDWTFGLTLGADWMGFDFNVFFQGTYGNDIFEYAQRSDVPSMNRPEWILDRWHGEGTSNHIPRLTSLNENQNWRSSDLYIKDGSYVRLKTAQIGYTLPASITKKAAIQRLRFFVAGENLLTFTKYEGFDVEIGERGVDRGIYPQSRTISVGASVTF